MKHLNSGARAQVDDGVPPVCWVGSRVLLGRDFVKCVLPQRDFARATHRRAWMRQSLVGPRFVSCSGRCPLLPCFQCLSWLLLVLISLLREVVWFFSIHANGLSGIVLGVDVSSLEFKKTMRHLRL